MKIGLVLAIETESLLEYYKEIRKLDCPAGYEVYKTESGDNEIFVIRTGMGESASSAGTQYVITKYDVDMIMNFGVVGGLTADMKKHKVCIVENVVHYRYDATQFMDLAMGQVAEHDSVYLKLDEKLIKYASDRFPDLNVVNCASADKFVADPSEKEDVSRDFNCQVCDMESAGIVLTCEANSIPCFIIKAVSDGLSDGAKGFYEELKEAGTQALKVLDSIIEKI